MNLLWMKIALIYAGTYACSENLEDILDGLCMNFMIKQ